MAFTTTHIFITASVLTYLFSMLALVIIGVIMQSMHCGMLHNLCNLTRIDDIYMWWPTQFINNTQQQEYACEYNGTTHLKNNTWELTRCYINVNGNNSKIAACPSANCGEFSEAATVFGAAEWLFYIGLIACATILAGMLGYHLYLKLYEVAMRCVNRNKPKNEYIAVHVQYETV